MSILEETAPAVESACLIWRTAQGTRRMPSWQRAGGQYTERIRASKPEAMEQLTTRNYVLTSGMKQQRRFLGKFERSQRCKVKRYDLHLPDGCAVEDASPLVATVSYFSWIPCKPGRRRFQLNSSLMARRQTCDEVE
jgi:hypothetical protein